MIVLPQEVVDSTLVLSLYRYPQTMPGWASTTLSGAKTSTKTRLVNVYQLVVNLDLTIQACLDHSHSTSSKYSSFE